MYPGSQVDIEEGDPGWIGAWWLGFPIIGSLIILFALPLILFPERLPKMNTDAAKRNKMETEKMMADEVTNKQNSCGQYSIIPFHYRFQICRLMESPNLERTMILLPKSHLKKPSRGC